MSVTRNYFQKFPTVSYGDYVVRDISLRTKLSQYLMESGIALLPYTVKEGERADSIASFYYEDPYYAWAIYLVNGIIDPYAEWPKDKSTFDAYIEATYGSFEGAVDTIVRYEVDWASDTTLLSPEQHAALTPAAQKYWSAQFGFNNEIISYYRRPVDTVMLNNRIDQITVVASNNQVVSLSNWSNSAYREERLYQYNFANDLAVKSTLLSVNSTTDANDVSLGYTNSTVYDINFESGNSTIFLKSTLNILPRANVSGTGIPSGSYVTSVVDGNHITLSLAPTSSPIESTYTVSNPASAVLTVYKVDFNDAVFASTGSLAAPNSFFTYTKNMNSDGSTNSYFTAAYRDIENGLVGRKSNNRVIVLDHRRIDDPGNPQMPDSQAINPANALLSNSHLSNSELVYWKSVNAYDDEVQKNEQRKEIYVLDSLMIGKLDDELEKLLGNV